MRVLHVQRVKGIGGSERHLLDLLPGLRDRTIDARMCVLSVPGAEPFVDELRARGVPLTVIRCGPDLDPRVTLELRRVMRAFRPDVVHTHLVHADSHGQLAARSTGIRAVSSIHGTHVFRRSGLHRRGIGLSLRSAARVIAISRHVARSLVRERVVPRSRIRMVPYGVDAERYVVASARRARVRQELVGPDDAFVLGMASRLIPGKGHELAIEAMAQTTSSLPNARLVIAGDGPSRAELEATAERLAPDRVRFVGFVDDVPGLMAAFDVLLFLTRPELEEGFGLAALEAMAAGRPVIASRLASLPEILGADGGVLVPPGSVDAVARAMVALEAEGSTRRGERARARAAGCFGLPAMIDGTVRVYDEVLGRG